MSESRKIEIPVSLVMERRTRRHGPWAYPQWAAVAVLKVGADGDGIRGGSIRIGSGEVEQHLWSGLRVSLHRDAAESYWYNLVGRQPSLFVICRTGRDGELTPHAVTADYDEAGAHLEADDSVFAVPIAPDIRRRLEEYVMANYDPAPPTKRRRKNWTEASDYGQ